MRWDPNKPQPTIQDFDKKLVEADAYLQIIIDQVKALELRMEGLSNHEDKMRCQSIVNHANWSEFRSRGPELNPRHFHNFSVKQWVRNEVNCAS
ncbi:unnamed protein product [Timema podura]|uniref:Uncharacterized protein n=1 Tax=Timema podura TaxID=61482 RepID=A0ABN7P1U9_TIMPD|nr:unnamed protein product [Timema podura]